MTGKWLNLFLHFSGYIFSLKQKIVEAKSWIRALPYVFLFLLAELAFLFISLPLYLVVSPKKLQERGLVFPLKEKENNHFHSYIVRRKISLTTALGAGGIFLLKLIFIGLVSSYLLGAQTLLAATQDWNFNTPADYTYDGAKIEVTGGVAQLKAITNAVSGSTTNSGFDTDATGWTYADWLQPTQTTANGVYKSSGGNPGGYVDIDLSTTKKNKTIAGLWWQAFTTTVNSPDTATFNFDWKSLTYTSPSAPVTYKLYAFIDTGGGNPTLGQEVWTSGEITGTTSWASTATIDIKSKVAAAGTYYLKIAAYATTPNTDKTFNYISNFDNVIVNWSKTTVSYDSSQPSINPNASLSPVGVTVWNSFIPQRKTSSR